MWFHSLLMSVCVYWKHGVWSKTGNALPSFSLFSLCQVLVGRSFSVSTDVTHSLLLKHITSHPPSFTRWLVVLTNSTALYWNMLHNPANVNRRWAAQPNNTGQTLTPVKPDRLLLLAWRPVLCKHERISKWQSVSLSSLAFWTDAPPLISSGLIRSLSQWVETLSLPSLPLTLPFQLVRITHTYRQSPQRLVIFWSGWTSEWLLKGNVLTFEDYSARHFCFCSSLCCCSPPLDYFGISWSL